MTILGISLFNLITWAIFGLVVGFVVHKIDPGDVKGGVWGTMLLGIAGAIVGGLLSLLIFHVAAVGFTIQGFLTAVVGGLFLALIHRLLFRGHDNIKTTSTQLR